MTPEELREIMAFLERRVAVDAGDTIAIHFPVPGREEMVAAGLAPDGVDRLLAAPWWDEMVADIVDTPSLCSDEPADTVLRYARDVVGEYLRKRFAI